MDPPCPSSFFFSYLWFPFTSLFSLSRPFFSLLLLLLVSPSAFYFFFLLFFLVVVVERYEEYILRIQPGLRSQAGNTAYPKAFKQRTDEL